MTLPEKNQEEIYKVINKLLTNKKKYENKVRKITVVQPIPIICNFLWTNCQ
jgi:hypothetical protein